MLISLKTIPVFVFFAAGIILFVFFFPDSFGGPDQNHESSLILFFSQVSTNVSSRGINFVRSQNISHIYFPNLLLPSPFVSFDDLQRHHEWETYLDSVYGISTLRFPVELHTFTFFYRHKLPTYFLIELEKAFSRGQFWGHIGWLQQVGFRVSNPGFRELYNFPQGLPSFTQVEVSRSCCDHPGTGMWFHKVIGSGVYLNLGRTIGFETHQGACRYFTNGPCPILDFDSDQLNLYFIPLAARLGYETLQFFMMHSHGEYEIVDLRAKSVFGSGTCFEPHLIPYYRSGWKGSKSCICAEPEIYVQNKQTIRKDDQSINTLINCHGVSKISKHNYRISIFFTGDIHSHFKNADKVACHVSRQRLNLTNPSLFIDVGDMFIGSNFFQQYGTRGVAEIMREMKYDAIGIGNHDFEHFASLEEFSELVKVPLININANNSSFLHRSKEFLLGGRKICITGYSVIDSKIDNIYDTESDIIRLLHAETHILKFHSRCDHIFLIAHGGWDRDLRISNELANTVDVIFGGHDHLLHSSFRKKEPVTTPIIIHCGSKLSHIGALHLEFYNDKLISALDETNLVTQISPCEYDSSVTKMVTKMISAISSTHVKKRLALTHVKSGKQSPVPFGANHDHGSLAGNFVAQAMRQHFLCNCQHVLIHPFPVISIIESGSVRTDIVDGSLHDSDIDEMLPWNNDLILLRADVESVQNWMRVGIRSMLDQNRKKRDFASAGFIWGYNFQNSSGLPSVIIDNFNHNECLSARTMYSSSESVSNYSQYFTKQPNQLVFLVITDWLARGGDGFPRIVDFNLNTSIQIGMKVIHIQSQALVMSVKHFVSGLPLRCDSQQQRKSLTVSFASGAGSAIGAMISHYITYHLAFLQTLAVIRQNLEDTKSDCKNLQAMLICSTGRLLSTLSVGISIFLFWFSFDEIQNFVSDFHIQTVTKDFICSVLAGIINVLITNPLWVIVVHLQKSNSIGFRQLFSRIFIKNGAWALFAGIWPNIAMISFPVIQSVFYFALLRSFCFQNQPSDSINIRFPCLAAFASAIATILATSLTYSLQVVRIRSQAGVPLLIDEVPSCKMIYMSRLVIDLHRGYFLKLAHAILNSICLFFFREQFIIRVLD